MIDSQARQHVYAFLSFQKLLTIATTSEKPWTANVFYGVDQHLNLYFVSNEKTLHSENILTDSQIAFNTAWFNPKNHADRKAIQGIGTCTIATRDEDIAIGVRLHNERFLEFASRITEEWIKRDDHASHIWIIQPSYIKFWNDELYEDDEYNEFHLT